MKRLALGLAVLAALGLQGCEREPVVTTVTPPTHSLPDDTPLGPPAEPQAGTGPQAAGQVTSAGQEPAAPATATMGAPSASEGGGDPEGQRLLARHALLVPVAGIAPAALADNYQQSRGGRQHEAIDILAPAGTPVVATDDGRIAKLFHSKPGGLTIYQFDPDARLAFYYAHLQRYAQGVQEGMDVKRGDVIGYVGSSGNADPGTPHLHFAVFKLGDPPKWWQGAPVNPYPALAHAQVASR